jgi:hypothetical protein
MIETIRQDLRYAVRSFRRAPLAALTIVVTVALGLGVVAVVFTVYDVFLLRADAVRKPGELYAVELERWTGPGDADEDLPFTRRDYDALRRETSVFTDAFAMVGSARVTRVEGRPAVPVLVSGNFFQVLGVQAGLGRPLLPGDDERFAGEPVIVLSHAGWRKLFRSDPSVIGRRATINGAPYEIVGVMPDGFRGLGVTPPDYWGAAGARRAVPRRLCRPRRRDGRRGHRAPEADRVAGGGGRRARDVGIGTNGVQAAPPGAPSWPR